MRKREILKIFSPIMDSNPRGVTTIWRYVLQEGWEWLILANNNNQKR